MTPTPVLRRAIAGTTLVAVLTACSSSPSESLNASPTEAAGATATATAAASAATSVVAGLSEICDPWLSPDAIVTNLGQMPTKVDGYNFLNVGTPADCKWTFADGSYLQLFALEQPEYGQVSDYLGEDGTRTGGVDYIEDLGIIAFYDAQEGLPSSLGWFPDNDLQLQLATEPTGASQVISKGQLITLAHLVTIPSPLPVAPAN